MAIVPEEIEAYASDHTQPVHPLYEALREETYAKAERPHMQVGHLEGRLLTLLAQLTGARRAVEVGTFTGYSALCIAEGMAEGGRLVTCDIDEETTRIAQRYFDRAPWGSKITLALGRAAETLARLEGPFDLAFLDADKESYRIYWDLLVPKMRPGGILVVDNVLWSGRVLDPQSETDHAIVDFNRHARADERVEGVLLTVRDGVLLARKR